MSPKNWHIIKNFDKEKESWRIWTKNKGLSKFRPKNGALDFLPKNGISSKILIKRRSPGKFKPIIGGLPKCRLKKGEKSTSYAMFMRNFKISMESFHDHVVLM